MHGNNLAIAGSLCHRGNAAFGSGGNIVGKMPPLNAPEQRATSLLAVGAAVIKQETAIV